MDTGAFSDRLLAAVSEDRRDAGITIEAKYRAPGTPSPPDAAGGKVMPPSFPGGPYLYEPADAKDGEPRVVILDQVPSQANRIEEALLGARDSGLLDIPLFEMIARTSRGDLRLTSLEFPHRYADAYLRDSTVDGVRFDASDVGKRLRMTDMKDASPLFERDPVSLIFGAWDSHRKGRWPKFARIYQSEMIGLDPREGTRRGTRMDPLNLTGGIDDKDKAEADWKYSPGGAGDFPKARRISAIGHGDIAPQDAHGGVSITSGRRKAWLSLAGLERIRFGAASAEASRLARGCLAALALAGDRLAFDRPSVWLRSGCDLIRTSEVLAFEGYSGLLDEAYADGRPAWQVRARLVPYAPDSQPAPEQIAVARPFTDLLIFGFNRGAAALHGRAALSLTAALRRALMSRIGTDVPPPVSGHGADDRAHVAYLALPDVGHGHADGHLLGVALALPASMTEDELGRVLGASLDDPLRYLKVRGDYKIGVSYRPFASSPWGLVPDRWTAAGSGGSRRWVTATPLMLDRHPHGTSTMISEVAWSLRRAGYPEPEEIEVSPAALLEGAVHRVDLTAISLRKPHRPLIHAKVTFPQPVTGPVIAGALKYLGAGLFAPLADQR